MSRSRAALGAGAATLALVAACCALAWVGGASIAARPGGVVTHARAWPTFALVAAAFACYVGGLALLARRPARTAAVLAVATGIQLAPLAAPLLTSTDAWTYWAYGRVAAVHGADPYRTRPSRFPADPAVRAMGSRWRERTSLYGPGFTLASEPVARTAGGSRDAAAWAFKTIAGLAALAAAFLAARLSRRPALGAAFAGWNPLLALHSAGGGHNDAWVAALVLAALALVAAQRRQAAGAAWVLAVAVKWVPLVFLVLAGVAARSRRERPAAAGLLAAAAAVAAAAFWRYGWGWLRAVVPLAENAHLETRYALPHRLEMLGAPHLAALGLTVGVLAAGVLWLAREAARGRPRLARAALLLLVVTPYLAVWYLAWAVALAAADDDDRVARIGVLAISAYLLPQTLAL